MKKRMKRRNVKRKRSVVPWAGMLGILLTGFIVCFTAGLTERQKKEETYHTMDLYGVRTEALLNDLFHKTDIVESMIITSHGSIDERTFNDLAKTLTEGEGIKAIQYLPDGIVKYCYPLEGNESVIGDNLFEMPERREGAMLALETKQIAISGPYDLTQGGFGMAARNPVFITDDTGEERFLGFSVVILELPEALKPLMLSELVKDGYQYELSCTVNGKTVTIERSVMDSPEKDAAFRKKFIGEPEKDYLEVEIQVPNNVWRMKVAPQGGWADKKILAFEGIVGLCFTCFCVIIVWLLEQREKQMEQFATTDELTGLFNRRRLKEYMDIRCRDRKVPFALFYLDLNHFKKINDSMGHACGDAVLQETAKRLKAAMGKEDSVYRIGGDEFIALMEGDVDESVCLYKMKRIAEEFKKPFAIDGKPVCISAGIGCAKFPEEGGELDTLMKVSDQKMYRSKERQKASPDGKE